MKPSKHSAEEVSFYLSSTSRIIEKWIRRGEDDDCPVSTFTSRDELHKRVPLKLAEDGVSDEDLFSAMETILDNSVNPWTGRFVDKLYSSPLPCGIAAEALLSAINANAHVISASPMLCLAEEACVSSLAALCGWDVEESDGLTMPGGSASNTLATQTSLTSIFPTFRQLGAYGIISSLMAKGRSVNASRPLVFTGQEGHYSIEKAAMACGLGLDSVVAVPCNEDGTMDTAALEDMMDNAFKDSQGQSTPSGFPFFVNATAGSTVMGAFDALNKVADVCHKLSDRYSTTIWMHVDASWGGPVLFSQKHRSRMAGVERFDSLTICPHKLMNIPHQCSFALFRRGETLDCNTLDAPYLYHDSSSNGNIRQLDKRGIKAARKSLRREAPSKAAFGCGRRGDALKLYLAWLSKGSRFFSDQVDQAIVLAQKIYTLIKTDPHLDSRLEITSRHTSKDGLYAQICFRPRLKQLSQMRRVDAEDRSKSTRHVHALLQKQQRFAVDFAPVGGNEGDFIRMITHPGTSLEKLVDLVHQIAVMGNEYDRERSRAT